MLTVFLNMTSVNALVILLEAFFNIFGRHTHTQAQKHCFTLRAQGNKSN